MNRITAYENGDWRSIPFEKFENNFFDICEAHRAQGRALAFAFILFDRSNPYVRSALAQKKYWDALDERAGRYLSVFSLDVRHPEPEPALERRWMYTSVAPTYDRFNSALSGYFEGIDRARFPSILFFQVADKVLIDSVAVTIAETDLSVTYRELESVIGIAADAVTKVENDNAKNAREIFNLILSALDDRQKKVGLLKLYHMARPLAEIAAIIELIRMIIVD